MADACKWRPLGVVCLCLLVLTLERATVGVAGVEESDLSQVEDNSRQVQLDHAAIHHRQKRGSNDKCGINYLMLSSVLNDHNVAEKGKCVRAEFYKVFNATLKQFSTLDRIRSTIQNAVAYDEIMKEFKKYTTTITWKMGDHSAEAIYKGIHAIDTLRMQGIAKEYIHKRHAANDASNSIFDSLGKNMSRIFIEFLDEYDGDFTKNKHDYREGFLEYVADYVDETDNFGAFDVSRLYDALPFMQDKFEEVVTKKEAGDDVPESTLIVTSLGDFIKLNEKAVHCSNASMSSVLKQWGTRQTPAEATQIIGVHPGIERLSLISALAASAGLSEPSYCLCVP